MPVFPMMPRFNPYRAVDWGIVTFPWANAHGYSNQTLSEFKVQVINYDEIDFLVKKTFSTSNNEMVAP
jgi:hypothetical protein